MLAAQPLPHSTDGDELQQHPQEDGGNGLDHNPGASAMAEPQAKGRTRRSRLAERSRAMRHTRSIFYHSCGLRAFKRPAF